MAAQVSASALGYNVDSLAPTGDSQLIAGLSNFVGRQWTGAVAVLQVAAGEAETKIEVQALLELRAGVPSVACLPQPDAFTGEAMGPAAAGLQYAPLHCGRWPSGGGTAACMVS